MSFIARGLLDTVVVGAHNAFNEWNSGNLPVVVYSQLGVIQKYMQWKASIVGLSRMALTEN